MSITVKSGDTFSLSCTRVDANGAPVNLTGLTITSKVRNISGFEDDLTVTVTNAAAGQFSLSALPADTSLWPVSQSVDGTVFRPNILYCDVQYVTGGVTQSSETFDIVVVEDVT